MGVRGCTGSGCEGGVQEVGVRGVSRKWWGEGGVYRKWV